MKTIFRSAAPTYASEEDKAVLLDKLNIMTLVSASLSFPCTPGAITGTTLDCQTNQEVEAKTMAMSRIAHDIWDAGTCKFLGGGGAGVEVTTRCSE